MPRAWIICPKCGGTEKYKTGRCRTCRLVYQKGLDPEKRKANQRATYVKHRDKRLAAVKLSWSKNKPKYRKANRIKAYQKGGWAPGEPEKAEELRPFVTTCACCGSNSPRSRMGWAADHDHKTGLFRGFLCVPCNIHLGYAEKYNLGFTELEAKYLNNHLSRKIAS